MKYLREASRLILLITVLSPIVVAPRRARSSSEISPLLILASVTFSFLMESTIVFGICLPSKISHPFKGKLKISGVLAAIIWHQN